MKKIVVVLLSAVMLVGCEAYNNSNKAQRGAVLGAAGGALLGAILGNNIKGGSSEMGAVFGTVIGGAAGSIIGNQMDKQAKKIEEEIPGAEVQRIDDGIVVTFDENSGVYFDTNKSNVNAASQVTLDKLVGVLKEYPETNVIVIGHTDSTGRDSYNMTLSEKRAKSVTDYFISNGLDKNRFTTKWFGEEQPTHDNSTPEGRAKNRRVNVVIVPNETMKAEAQKQAEN